MKTIIRLSNILVLSLLLFSCSDDFLDLKPSNSITAGDAITNLKEANIALNGIYRRLTSTDHYANLMGLYAEYKGGDMVVPMNGRGDGGLFSFTHEESSGAYYDTYWDHRYNTILQINNVIANIESGKVVVTPSEQASLNDARGQAYTLRALLHFDVVRVYGNPYLKDNGASWGAAIVTEVLPASTKMQRSTVADTYTQIESDLKVALDGATPLLSKVKNNGKINYWAAKALYARVLLYKGDWGGAYTQAKEVIEQQTIYSLYANDEWVPSWKSSMGKEAIFELIVKASENDPGNGSIRRYLLPGYNNGLAALVASDDFLTRLDSTAVVKDIRWGIMGIDEYGYAAANDVSDPKYGRKGWCQKYEVPTGSASMTIHGLPIIRLSEVYLIGAEAALKKSSPDLASCVTWLNAIRKRAPSLAPALTTDTDLEQKILDERSKELVCEGHRFFDMMRLGKSITYMQTDALIPGNGRPVGQAIDWNYYKIVMPIALSEKRVNPDIHQNNGY